VRNIAPKQRIGFAPQSVGTTEFFMKHSLLMTTTAVALVAATSFALAQGMPMPDSSRGATTAPVDKNSTDKGSAPAMKQAPGAAEQKAMPGAAVKADDKTMPPKSTAEQKMPPATPPMKAEDKADIKNDQAAPSKSSAAPGAAEQKAMPGAAVKADDKAMPPKSTAEQKTPPATTPMKAEGKAEMKSDQAAPAKSSAAPSDATAKSAQTPTPAASPRTSASASASLSSEQSAQVRSVVISDRNAPRVSSVNFSINVGTVVPRNVRYVPLPSRVISIYPAWRGYSYFLVGDQILVVDPRTHRIVAVLAA
jgi:hypothetical protein